jgi:hypothetical protein
VYISRGRTNSVPVRNSLSDSRYTSFSAGSTVTSALIKLIQIFRFNFIYLNNLSLSEPQNCVIAMNLLN